MTLASHGADITIDPAAPTPPYEQIRAQLAEHITTGRLGVGTRLPTVRQLASDLGVAVNTVARSYRELESGGLIETRGRGGTVVLGGDAAHEQAYAAAQEFARVVRSTGLTEEQALQLVRTALAQA